MQYCPFLKGALIKKYDKSIVFKTICTYEKYFSIYYNANDFVYIDDVIEPSETRNRIISGLELLKTKVDSNPKKKHGNIPL